MNTSHSIGSAIGQWLRRGRFAVGALLITGAVAVGGANQQAIEPAQAGVPTTTASTLSTAQLRYLDVKIRQANQMEQRGYAATPTALSPARQRYLNLKIRQAADYDN